MKNYEFEEYKELGIVYYKIKRNDLNYSIFKKKYSEEENNITYIFLENDEGTINALSYNSNNGEIILNDDCISVIGLGLVNKLIGNACYYLSSRIGVTPVIKSTMLNTKLYNEEQDKKIIDIKPIIFDGDINLDDISTINGCIEMPLRKACSLLNEKGIQTIMSSCNCDDVKYRNSKIREYALGRGRNDSPFFIGNGYAWIMIDWLSLSEENKNIFVQHNLGSSDIELTEKEQETLQINIANDPTKLTPSKQLTRFLEIINGNKFRLYRELFGHLIQESQNDEIFDKNRNGVASYCSLNNHGDDFRTVILRYPIDEITTVSDVESYFVKYTNKLIKQERMSKQSMKIKW